MVSAFLKEWILIHPLTAMVQYDDGIKQIIQKKEHLKLSEGYWKE